MSTLDQLMHRNPISVAPGTTVRAAAKRMKEKRIGSVLVKKSGKYIGIVTDTDVVRKVVALGKDTGKLTVDKIMTAPLCTIEGSRPVDDAQDMMGDLGVRHLGVTRGGDIVGVVSVRDLLLFYMRYAQSKISPQTKYSEPKISQD